MKKIKAFIVGCAAGFLFSGNTLKGSAKESSFVHIFSTMTKSELELMGAQIYARRAQWDKEHGNREDEIVASPAPTIKKPHRLAIVPCIGRCLMRLNLIPKEVELNNE